MLAGKHNIKGHWNSYSHRPPLEDSKFTATAITIRALRLFAPPGRRKEMDERIRRATRWLAQADPRSTEESSMRLFGLAWGRGDQADIARAKAELLRQQRADGGWAQITTRQSDAYATGQVLVALNQAGGLPSRDPRYRRGVAFLLDTQKADGSWLVETRRTRAPGLPYFETGFPHGKHQFISCAATAWGDHGARPQRKTGDLERADGLATHF
jgi:Squalene-hopene cyclase N-terminal domain